MEILSLSVRDFRNYENFSVNFQEGVNLIYGKNGVGKTNLLEAIFLFASGKSFRGSKEKEMVNFLGENAKIKLVFKDRIGIHTLEAELFKNRKKILYRNGIEIKKLSEYLGLFRAVIFTPDHLSLIKGSPEFRR
ncbi:MAG: AAA family ATPase, partial [Clostridia bacterium]